MDDVQIECKKCGHKFWLGPTKHIWITRSARKFLKRRGVVQQCKKCGNIDDLTIVEKMHGEL